MSEATYLAQRQDTRWVVLRGTSIISSYPLGAAGAQDARAEADRRNAQPARTPDLGLASWRKTYGFTQQQLADRLGVGISTYQRWEYGESRAPAMLTLALERLEQLL